LLQVAGGVSQYDQLIQDVLFEINPIASEEQLPDAEQYVADVFITAEGEEVADSVENDRERESSTLKPLQGLDLPAVAVTLWCLQQAGCKPDEAWLSAAAEYVQNILIDAVFEKYKHVSDGSRPATSNDAKMAVSALFQLGVKHQDLDLAADLLYWVHLVSDGSNEDPASK
jgi:hypothetical protein